MNMAPAASRSKAFPLLGFPPRHSLRFRLAVWHTVTLAVFLCGFGVTTYVFFTRILSQQVDQEMLASVQSIESGWMREQREFGSSVSVAAAEEVAESRSRNERVIFFDRQRNIIAISDTTPLVVGLTVDSLFDNGVWSINAVVARTTAGKPTLATLGIDDTPVRAVVSQLLTDGQQSYVVVLRDISAQDQARETLGGWLFAAIPIALLCAGIGGYLLARASLAPVTAIGEQAERISASSLSERLVLANPEDEIGRLAAVLNGLLARLEHSFQQQRQFMADASHEVRTPVTIIRSAVDVALDRDDTPVADLRHVLRIVSVEGRRLTRIVDDLFLLARVDAGQQPVQISHFFLEELVADIAVSGQALGRTRGVTVTSISTEEAPIHGDEALIGRLLLNLVENAISHSPSNGAVHLRLDIVRDGRLPNGMLLAGRWHRILVADHGHGVDPAIQTHLFDRFVRRAPVRGNEADSPVDGAGLGLAIGRWIASAHGGHVAMQSTGPTGSVFAVWLPEALVL